MTIDLESKFLGSLIGSAIGDAIGELCFHFPEKEELLSNLERASLLRYTDDTAMAIGLAEAIIEKGDIDQRRLGDMFSQNFKREPWRGYASGPPTIFNMVQGLGIPYTEAARRLFGGTGSLGNGAAMRIAPVGLFFHNSSELYEKASASAEVTHAHPVGMDGAAIQALAVATATGLDPEKEFRADAFIRELIDSARTNEIREKIELVEDLIDGDVFPDMAADRIGRTVTVHESMPFAVYSFLRHPESMEDCLYCAIFHGGDRDTLGAMACAVSGAYLGIKGIPLSWREKLENGPGIEKLALALAAKCSP